MLVGVLMVVVLGLAAAVFLFTRPSSSAVATRNPPAELAEPGHCTVVLGEAGPRPIQTIKAVREATDVGLGQAKDWVEGAPCSVAGGLSHASADRLRARLESAGATAWVEDRSVP